MQINVTGGGVGGGGLLLYATQVVLVGGKKCMKMLALTMLSSSLRSLELVPLAYSSFTLLRAAQNKTSPLKVFLKTHFLARFDGG